MLDQPPLWVTTNQIWIRKVIVKMRKKIEALSFCLELCLVMILAWSPAKKYVMTKRGLDKKDSDGDDDDDESKMLDKDSSESASVSGKRDDEEEQEEEDVYEQDKLESVFRDVREVWEKAPSNKASTPAVDGGSGGGFTFGFDLDKIDEAGGRQTKVSSNEATSFSFSFNIPGASDKAETKGHLISDPDGTAVPVDDGASNEDAVEDGSRPHRKGLAFPDKDLEGYVDAFFSCNEGERILADPDGFRNDDKEREAWKRERQSLTLDWKRKRKYAMTRIQKRVKI
mmetsp:Transcript_12916/g.20792  ORF Transcript_12916/g.20792 Transcript_12916/m.20792 type:complete len:284 (-) Transcript_12916:67-918(-)